MGPEATLLEGTPFEAETAVTPSVSYRAQRTWRDNPLARFFGVIADPAAWSALLYMLLSLATGIVYFTLAVTGISVSAGLIVLIVGVPVAVAFLASVRVISLFEGLIVEALLGVRVPRRSRPVESASGWEAALQRVKSWLSDRQTWTSLLYMLLMLPLGTVYFTLAVVAVALSVSAVAAPIAYGVFPWAFELPPSAYYQYYSFFHQHDPWSSLLLVAAGILGLFVTLWMARGIGRGHGRLAAAMLLQPVETGSTVASEDAA